MRAPLRAMRTLAQTALELDGSGLEKLKEFLRRILTASNRMDSLIVDALSYNHAMRQTLKLREIDVTSLLRGMIESYPEFQSCNVNIQIQSDMPHVLGNEAGLTQCLSNLLNNGLKFVAPGVTPQIRVLASTAIAIVRGLKLLSVSTSRTMESASPKRFSLACFRCSCAAAQITKATVSA